jgi:hypothetical protein
LKLISSQNGISALGPLTCGDEIQKQATGGWFTCDRDNVVIVVAKTAVGLPELPGSPDGKKRRLAVRIMNSAAARTITPRFIPSHRTGVFAGEIV